MHTAFVLVGFAGGGRTGAGRRADRVPFQSFTLAMPAALAARVIVTRSSPARRGEAAKTV